MASGFRASVCGQQLSLDSWCREDTVAIYEEVVWLQVSGQVCVVRSYQRDYSALQVGCPCAKLNSDN